MMAMLAYSDPGPASFHLPTMAFAFSVNSLVTSSKVRGAEGVVVELVVVEEEDVDIQFIMNSLKICHSTPSSRPCSRSKIASSFE